MNACKFWGMPFLATLATFRKWRQKIQESGVKTLLWRAVSTLQNDRGTS
jgi:hypothetical protein